MKKWFVSLVAVLLLVAIMVHPVGAAAGTVDASGANNSTISIGIGDASAEFGTNLDPEGLDSNSSESVLDYQGSVGNEGSYYVWKSSGSGLTVTVKSNAVWDGTFEATENGGGSASSSMTISSGVLLFSQGSEPASYTACEVATAFTVSATTWVSNVAKGSTVYIHYYCLRADWDDDPGTFISTVTYTVSN